MTPCSRQAYCSMLAAMLLPLLSGWTASVCSFYTVKQGAMGSYATMTIANNETDEFAEIVVGFGGRVEQLYLRSLSTGVMRNVLLSHHGDADLMAENKFWKGMLLIPWANRIDHGKYTFYNGTYQLHINENSPPPRSNALHGFMNSRPVDVIGTVESEMRGILSVSANIADMPGYPFSLRIDITYVMDAKGFSISMIAANVNGNGQPLPFYMGWHPYFNCTVPTTVVTFDPCPGWAHVDVNSNMVPTGIARVTTAFNGSSPIGGTPTNPTYYDDGYKSLSNAMHCFPLTTKIYDRATDQTVVLWQDANFPLVQVFTGSTTAFNESAVAVEPMSGMTDAYNNHDHLSILSDGETWSGSFGVYIL